LVLQTEKGGRNNYFCFLITPEPLLPFG